MKSTYIFIDGAYLQVRHNEITKRWFGTEADIDFRAVVTKLEELSGSASNWTSVETPTTRSFYYDCLDEDRRNDENDQAFEERIEKQDARLRNLRDIEGCHIRLGALKGAKQRRQKEVDVLIAVDMMSHAARGNMDKAVLLAGDLDFRPAIEALIQFGVFVQIIADEEKTSRELTWAASAYTKLSFNDFYGWSSEALRSQHPIPDERHSPPSNTRKVKEGSMNGNRCTLFQSAESDKKYYIHFSLTPYTPGISGRTFFHDESDRLELYLALQFGSISWDC